MTRDARPAAPIAVPPAPGALLDPAGGRVDGVRRIAVLRANGLGDFVVALSALAALRAAYPAARITYLGAPWHAELLAGRPGPWDEVVVVPPVPGVRNTVNVNVTGAQRGDGRGDGPGDGRDGDDAEAFLAAQRRSGYDLALQLHGGGASSNPFVEALGARVTVGSRDTDAPPLDRWLPYVYYQHEVVRFLEVVGLVGAPPVVLEPRLTVTAADRAGAGEVLSAAGIGADERLAVLHPGATDPRRRWPAGSFAEVAAVLARRGVRVVVVGHGPDDATAAGRIVHEAAETNRLRGLTGPPAVDLVGRLPLGASLAVYERAAVVVGNDSGPRHLAAAVGAATVGVYWVGNVVNAGPLTRRRHRVGVSFRTACPVCGAEQGTGRGCAHDPSFVADVPVGAVLSDTLELLATR